jgi:hypothetical protein
VAICDSEIELSFTCVSTSITLTPACFICWSGWIEALTSLGATSTASGRLAVTALMTGVCTGAPQVSPPVTLRFTPSWLAASWAPQAIEM